MDRSAANGYTYAKASGMLKKTFAGDNARRLFHTQSLSQLWEMIFCEEVPILPEVVLANKIEYNAVARFVKQYTHILQNYSKPDEFLVELLRRYEIENLKVIAAGLSQNEPKCPRVVDIGPYKLLHYDKWPDLHKITKGTPWAWYHDARDVLERQQLDYHLDLQEIKTLWTLVHEVKDESKDVLIDYVKELYTIKNLLWALRLKIYYKMDDTQVISNLFYVGDEPLHSDEICYEAFAVLEKDPENYNDWRGWRYEKFLNKHEEGELWTVDPMILEENFRAWEAALTRKLFHKYPETDATVVMFFKIKQQELDAIRAAVEWLRIGGDVNEAFAAAGLK